MELPDPHLRMLEVIASHPLCVGSHLNRLTYHQDPDYWGDINGGVAGTREDLIRWGLVIMIPVTRLDHQPAKLYAITTAGWEAIR